MSKKILVYLLGISMFLAGLSVNLWFTGITSVHAEDNDLAAWFSAEKDGGAISLLEKGSTAYVNYNYKGPESTYTVHVTVSADGGVLLSRQYSSVSSNSIPVDISAEAVYDLTVTVTAGGNTAAMHRAVMEGVTGLPVIGMQPLDVVTDIGKEARFSVESQTADASFQWYSSSSLSDPGEAVSGASSETLVISAENVVSGLNGTYYYCQITANGYTVNSNYALLSINGAAVPTNTPPGSSIPTKKPAVTATPAPTVPPGGGSTLAPTEAPGQTAACIVRAAYNIVNHKIKVTWNNCGTSYKVYRSARKNSGYSLKKTVTGTSYTDKSISHGKTYYYKVQAIKSGRTIKLSDAASARVNVKPKLKKFSAKKKGKSIKVTWKYNRADRISIYVDTGNGWGMLGSVKGTKTGCSIGVPKGYSKVKVRVRACNKVGKKKYYGSYSKTRTIKV